MEIDDRHQALKSIITNWEKYDPSPPELKLFSFLLYSSRSRLSRWIDEYCQELDDLTGPDFFVFLFAPIELFLSLHSVSSLRSAAISSRREYIYNVVRHFGAEVEDVPCLILFQDVKESDIIVLPLDTDWTDEELLDVFKEITLDVYRAQRKIKKDTTNIDSPENWEKAKKDFWKEIESSVKKRMLIPIIFRTGEPIIGFLSKFRK